MLFQMYIIPSVFTIVQIFLYRFRCLLKTLSIRPERVRTVALACCVLHNLLRLPSMAVDREDPITHEITPGSWRDGISLSNAQRLPKNTANYAAKSVGDTLTAYFNSSRGSVPWQENMV